MTREIKFRAYDLNKKIWGTLAIGTSFESRLVPWGRDFALMQYTGLKDKNGREIYEGDILNTQQTGYGFYRNVNDVVVFVDGEFVCNDNSLGYQLKNDDFTIEVIGNIHGNPGLLQPKREEDGRSD